MRMSSSSAEDSRHFQGINFHSVPEACLKAKAKRREDGIEESSRTSVSRPKFCQPTTWPGMFPARKQRALAWAAQADSQELRYVERELAVESQVLKVKALHRSCDARGARASASLPKPLKAPQ